MEYKNTNAWVLRAREEDEPFVIDALRHAGITARQGTVVDDWNHIDLFAEMDGEQVVIDVKRNHSSQAYSPNFTFTFVNSKRQEFTYRKNGFLAFINDANGEIYLVSHQVMQSLVAKCRHFESKFSENQQYILIPKNTIKMYSRRVFIGDRSKLS